MRRVIGSMAIGSPKGRQKDGLRGSIGVSLLLHLGLFAAVMISSRSGFSRGVGWGTTLGGGTAVRVQSVASLQGIPLPTSMRVATSTVANQTGGLYKPLPKLSKKLEPTLEAEIPKFDKAALTPKFERINPRIQKEEMEIPDNAVPFGQGGAPAISHAQFSNTVGQGGIDLGEDFGTRFAWYVQAVRARISTNWLMATVSPRILTAPRLYITFAILQNGQIENVKVTESSGIFEVDRSGLRAVLSSNPLTPLPRSYSGSSVTVEFWFDFQRR